MLSYGFLRQLVRSSKFGPCLSRQTRLSVESLESRMVFSTASVGAIYVSSASAGSVGGVSYADEDVLAFNMATQSWSILFDGSDVGLGSTDVDAFHIEDDGTILFSTEDPVTLPDVGLIQDEDIVRFVPTTTGPETTGTFEVVLDGSSSGLPGNSEDVDAIARTPDGRLLISTWGEVSVPGLTAQDEDLLVFDPARGTWQLYFDGSDVGLSNGPEDVKGAWVDPVSGAIYLSTEGVFSVPGLSGAGSDIFVCESNSTGETTSCKFSAMFDGAENGFAGSFDGISLGQSSVAGPSWQILVLVYANTDFTFTEGGVAHNITATMTQEEVDRATTAATRFVTMDVPELTSDPGSGSHSICQGVGGSA